MLAAALKERRLKRAFTIDVLGEAVTSESEADQWQRAYVDLIENLGPAVNGWPEVRQIDVDDRGPIPRVNVSIKLSALDSQFDPIDPGGSFQRTAARLREILRAAKLHRAHVHVDMESYRTKDLTLHVFKNVLMEDEFRDTADVGIVIQCYLKDSEADLMALRDWAMARGTSVSVRLVKGAYWDFETVHARASGWPVPVFQQKWQSDANFERLTRLMMLNHEFLRPRSAVTISALWRTQLRWPNIWACRAKRSSCKCFMAWPMQKSRRLSTLDIGCEFTCPTVN